MFGAGDVQLGPAAYGYLAVIKRVPMYVVTQTLFATGGSPGMRRPSSRRSRSSSAMSRCYRTPRSRSTGSHTTPACRSTFASATRSTRTGTSKRGQRSSLRARRVAMSRSMPKSTISCECAASSPSVSPPAALTPGPCPLPTSTRRFRGRLLAELRRVAREARDRPARGALRSARRRRRVGGRARRRPARDPVTQKVSTGMSTTSPARSAKSGASPPRMAPSETR